MTSRMHNFTPRNGSSSRGRRGTRTNSHTRSSARRRAPVQRTGARRRHRDNRRRGARRPCWWHRHRARLRTWDARGLSAARGVATRARPLRRSHRGRHPNRRSHGRLSGDAEQSWARGPSSRLAGCPPRRVSTPPNRTSNSNLAAASWSFYWAGVALCELGSYEPAAIIFGKADTMTTRKGTAWDLEMLAATDAALLETLGEQHFGTLAERGAGLEISDAIAYLRAEADQVLRQD